MLNKTLCKKCTIDYTCAWSVEDEIFWYQEWMVYCFHKNNTAQLQSILEEPPKDCPYLLEQILEENQRINHHVLDRV